MKKGTEKNGEDEDDAGWKGRRRSNRFSFWTKFIFGLFLLYIEASASTR